MSFALCHLLSDSSYRVWKPPLCPSKLKAEQIYKINNSLWIHNKGTDTGQTAAPKMGETGKYREEQFIRAEAHEPKPPKKPVLGENLNYN